MKFNPAVIQAKERYLDSTPPALVREAAERFLGQARIQITPVERQWSPGGGSQLFIAESQDGSCFIKAKHQSILVESALESEPGFIQVPSLENEKNFLRAFAASPHVPKLLGFETLDEYMFIATEPLTPFSALRHRLSPPRLAEAFWRLRSFVHEMYARGVVHTDIHEKNLCFRDEATPVLIDFEEARYKTQAVPFEASLDVAGRCGLDDVGEFPALAAGDIPGLTCLNRLKKVFRQTILEKLPAYLAACNFDNTSSFNLDAEQQPDERIYQSISLRDLTIQGQRPVHDERSQQVRDALAYARSILDRPLRVVDLGSNMGMFSFQCAAVPFVQSVTGLEADARYVEAAKVLSFYQDVDDRVAFIEYNTGSAPYAWETDVLLMLSVYHHIVDKDAFLQELAAKKITCLLGEFATQERYYPQRGGIKAEIEHIRRALGFKYAQRIAISKDYQRPMVAFHNGPEQSIYAVDARRKINFYREEPFDNVNRQLIAAAQKNDYLFLLKHITDQDFAHPEQYADEIFENRPALQFIFTYISRLPQSKKNMIVDIACGNCSLLQKLQSSGHQVAGVDISPVRILLNQNIIQNLRLGFAEALPLPNNYADIVVATEILEHCFNLDDTLSECERIMKPEAKLLLTVPLGEHNDGYNHLRHFSPESLRRCLAAANFQVAHLDLTSYTMQQDQDNILCIAVKTA